MLCDNCAAHSSDIRLTNVKLMFMPPSTMSLIQPMDQGITANFKHHYRYLVLCQLMATTDDSSDASVRVTELTKKLMLLDSLHIRREARSRITVQTTINCHRRASFIIEADDCSDEPGPSQADNASKSETEMNIHLPAVVTDQEFARYVDIDNDLAVSADNTDAVICAEVQATTADSGEMDDNTATAHTSNTKVNISTAMFSEAVQSLRMLCAYLEANGCQEYRRLYETADQVYDINRQKSLQISTTDYFSRL